MTGDPNALSQKKAAHRGAAVVRIDDADLGAFAD
jgi:hypothetical protein